MAVYLGDKQVSMVGGQPIIVEGTDTTSSNPVTASDMAEGTEAFVNGQKVVGGLTVASGKFISYTKSVVIDESSSVKPIVVSATPFPKRYIVDPDVTVSIKVDKYTFGDAKPEEVLSGKTFTSEAGLAVKGTYVPLNTSDATATASDMVSGKTAYVNGVKITGNIAKKSAQTYTPTTSDQTISSGQYLDGVQTIKGDANLVSANIKKGATIFGVAGSFEGGPQVGAIVKAYPVSNAQIASGSSTTAKVNYGSAVTSSNGVVSISSPTSVTVSSTSKLDVVKGKYVQQATSYGTTTHPVYFIPSTATFTQGGSTYNRTYTVSTANEMFVYGGQ